jgi:actin-related protein
MKKVILLLAVLSLTACGTFKPKVDLDAPISTQTVSFAEKAGNVEVTFTDNGEWVSIKSSATSIVPINDEAGIEQGMNVATMRAKRNIAEFLNTDLRSSTSTDAITTALAKTMSDGDEASKQKAANTAMEIKEKIAVEANAMLVGSYVSERKVGKDLKTVFVTVTVDKRSMKAARSIRTAFGN